MTSKEIKEELAGIHDLLQVKEDSYIVWLNDKIAEYQNKELEYMKIIRNQSDIIDSLLKAQQGAWSDGYFYLFYAKGELPVLIKDGEVLSNETIRGVTVSWSKGENGTFTLDQDYNFRATEVTNERL